MVETGRHLSWPSCPRTLLRKSHPEQAAQDHVQMAFQYLQGRKHHSLYGQPVPLIRHHHIRKVFSDVQREPPVFQFVPVASDPVTEHL